MSRPERLARRPGARRAGPGAGAWLALLLIAWPAAARGGGLALPFHGVRALGRGGAVVAGGNDPGALYYNSAAIAGLPGIQVSADAAFLFYEARHTRVDSGGNLLPSVSFEGPTLPLPTLGVSLPVLRDRLWTGLSLTAPYSPVSKYPQPSYAPCDPEAPLRCLDTAHTDAPQRYSLISQEGTTLIQLDLAVAVQVLPGLYLGASLQNLFVTFIAITTISSYNGALSSGPEDPEFDSLTQMTLKANFNPSAKLGLIWLPHPRVRVGLAYQLPFWIRGAAKINVQLPVSPLYQAATVEGDEAEVEMDLPMSLRAGVEVQLLQGLAVELDLEWEQWSVTEAIRINPKNIFILNLPSIDRYRVPVLENPLHFQDTFVLRLGGEYRLARLPLVLRGGYTFERGAVQQRFASVLSMDSDKHVLTLGAGYTFFGVRLDLAVARSFSGTRVVDFQESQAYQVNPINQSGAAGVGGGSYQANFTLIGIGLHRAF